MNPFLLYILLLGGWTSATEFVFDPNSDYTQMEFEPRHRGGIDLPPCIKDLMNCWEVMNPDKLCKVNGEGYALPMETICMDLRLQCREYMGYAVFPEMPNADVIYKFCTGTMKYNKEMIAWRWPVFEMSYEDQDDAKTP